MTNNVLYNTVMLSLISYLIWSFSCVSSFVKPKPFFDCKSFSTMFTNIRHLSSVTSHMNSQTSNLHKISSTDTAFIRLFSSMLQRLRKNMEIYNLFITIKVLWNILSRWIYFDWRTFLLCFSISYFLENPWLQ